jgi:hypothetical protein
MRLVLFVLFLMFPTNLPAVTLTGPESLTDATPAPVRVTGLPPGSELAVVAEQHVGWAGGALRSETRFKAAADGSVDTARDAPLSGSYAGVSVTGPFWSAQPTGLASTVPEGAARLVATTAQGEVHTLLIPALPASVVRRAVPDFPGAVLVQPLTQRGRLPVVIVLGGSEGGTFTANTTSPMLAAQGFAVLGLPYYAPAFNPADKIPGLPTSFTEIPADRLLAVKA